MIRDGLYILEQGTREEGQRGLGQHTVVAVKHGESVRGFKLHANSEPLDVKAS
jgi:hypothetical protein